MISKKQRKSSRYYNSHNYTHHPRKYITPTVSIRKKWWERLFDRIALVFGGKA